MSGAESDEIDLEGKYVGEMVLGNYEGKGRIRYADGENYEGQWKANL